MAEMRIFTRVESLFDDSNQTSARNNMKLEFRNNISQEIFTGDEIKGEGNTPIEVALVDSTGKIVDVGPEASASVEIVVLQGEADDSKEDDWTVEEFNKNIVREVPDKKPLLAKNAPLKLQRGLGVIKNVKFRHHARPSVFKLGARVIGAVGGRRIKEAKTKPFTLKVYRLKAFKKHKTPSLSDKVHRLTNISQRGKYADRLRAKQINTVEKFLIQLLIYPAGLKDNVKMGEKKWKATVENARACTVHQRMYTYKSLEQNTAIVFDVLGQVHGLYIHGQYSATNMLTENQKAYAQELLASALKNWGDVKDFDLANKQQYPGVSTNMDPPLGCLKPSCRGGDNENTGMSQMIGELSGRHPNIAFHGVSSAMNSSRDTGGEDDCSDSIDDLDVDAMVGSYLEDTSSGPNEFTTPQTDAVMRSSHNLEDTSSAPNEFTTPQTDAVMRSSHNLEATSSALNEFANPQTDAVIHSSLNLEATSSGLNDFTTTQIDDVMCSSPNLAFMCSSPNPEDTFLGF